MAAVVSISDCHKTFGHSVALDGLNLSVRAGEIHGFLGPNGAGKTVTLRILLGLIRANAGTVQLFGQDPWLYATDLHKRVAYVPGEVTLWPNLTGGETIDLLARLHGAVDRNRIAELLARFQLDPTRRTRTYSKGNKQKVVLVAALAAQADLLVLDEPTAGLDPLMEEVFRECLIERRAAGQTILLSSHILSEIEAVADRVTIIGNGRTIDTGSLAELRHFARISITAELNMPPSDLAQMSGVHDVTVHGNKLACQVDPAGLDALLRVLANAGVRTMTSSPPTLEELFLRHYAQPAGVGSTRKPQRQR